MRVYHFSSQEHILSDLQHRHLKIATLNDVNDPFELLSAAGDTPQERRGFKATKAALAKTVGMLCFSKNYTNPVQWSHYGDSHRGLCLGFDVPKRNLTQVRYSPSRLRPDYGKLLGTDEKSALAEMQRMLDTKYEHWRYEEEYRCFVSLEDRAANGLYFCDFSEELRLKEVIVGHRCEMSRDDVAAALGDLSGEVACSKVRLAFRSYKMVRQEKQSLWK